MLLISSSNPPQKTVNLIARKASTKQALTFKETMAKRIAHSLSFHHVSSYCTRRSIGFALVIIPPHRPVIKNFLDKIAENISKISKTRFLAGRTPAKPIFYIRENIPYSQ